MIERTNLKKSLTFCFLLMLAAAPLMSHDFWVAPWTYRPLAGTALPIQLLVGDHFQGEPLARNPTHLERFLWAAPGREPVQVRPLAGRLGRLEYRRKGGPKLPSGWDPAGFVIAEAPGLHLLAYQSRPHSTVMPSEHFRTHLVMEGQSQALKVYDLQPKQPEVKESYLRCAKSLLQVGEVGSEARDQHLGMPLELVADGNPYALEAGQAVPFQLLFQGKPLSGVRVTARFQDDPFVEASGRSDNQGRVRLRLGQSGVWMVKAVHTLTAGEDQEADWVSYWASTTFELPGCKKEISMKGASL